ncbi:hypothetical protein HOK09_04580 [Candidatus Woesearchaeota archaeon]|jgi:hypothetical protein|nr:hypothetical protein [Candidatus Woesearchaeota archaeon]
MEVNDLKLFHKKNVSIKFTDGAYMTGMIKIDSDSGLVEVRSSKSIFFINPNTIQSLVEVRFND